MEVVPVEGQEMAVVLHEDKKYYPTAEEVYGPDVEVREIDEGKGGELVCVCACLRCCHALCVICTMCVCLLRPLSKRRIHSHSLVRG